MHGQLGRLEEASLLVLGYERGVNALPLEILGNFGVQKHLHQLSISHYKLRYQINVPVTIVSILLGRLHAWSELTPEVGQV